MSHFRRTFLALLLSGLLVAAVTGCKTDSERPSGPGEKRDARVLPVPQPAPELVAAQAAFIEVSEKVTPSVVNIQAARVNRGPQLGPLFEDFFNELFRGRSLPPQRSRSLGSGVIISADGYILTNEHVVKGAEEIKVKLSDDRIYDGRLVGSDPRTDVAVLKIDSDEELPAAVLGDSDRLQVGQWALAIGNPFGLDRTLTVGVVSATGRTDIGIEDFEDFIQTDASINPGNSGGPLLNIYGEVVGINTAIVASGQGIGFAIPINMARTIAHQLMSTGQVARGWLGVGIQDLSAELAESFGLDRATGALVNRVLPDSPAQQAGIRRGDILLALNGRTIRNTRDLQLQVAGTPAGKTVPLEILRDGERLTVEVAIRSRDRAAVSETAGERRCLGLTLTNTENDDGIEVKDVSPRGIGAAAGIRTGDIILSLNNSRLTDLQSFDRALKEVRNNRIVRLLIKRGETTLYLAFPAADME
ncbi:MAG: serine protease DegQ [Desulfuromonadales bacterium]|jgi:serine protease Do/serine protease DegQ|nr:serine protease DegQ [Desulfuromonadales bacterium]